MVYCITALAEHKDLGGVTAQQVCCRHFFLYVLIFVSQAITKVIKNSYYMAHTAVLTILTREVAIPRT